MKKKGWRVRQGGAQFWAHAALAVQRDEHGAAGRFAYVVRDLTENRQTEEALRERADSYRLLFEQCPDALLVVSEGKIALANNATRRLLGVESPAALIGRTAADLVYENCRDELSDWLLGLQSKKKTFLPRRDQDHAAPRRRLRRVGATHRRPCPRCKTSPWCCSSRMT